MKIASASKKKTLGVTFVLGTRPEAIKLAPVVAAARQRAEFSVRVCSTGQHREMLAETLNAVGLRVDSDLAIMRRDQTLNDILSGTLAGVQNELQENRADWLVVQGDTTSAFGAALAAFNQRVKVAHVEAGLRTGNKSQPWPEEANRRLVSVVADRHYAPTEQARQNLIAEGIPEEAIRVTGNTVIDSLLAVSKRLDEDSDLVSALDRRFDWIKSGKRLILVTGHRRESFGEGFRKICTAIRQLGGRSDTQIVYPVHLNPNVRGPVFDLLYGVNSINLIDPVDYVAMVYLIRRCALVLTDSGGIQEEAPSFGKPVLVMRETTERMEAVQAGVAKLVGSEPADIFKSASVLLDSVDAYDQMATPSNPFGDGCAAERIVNDLLEDFFS